MKKTIPPAGEAARDQRRRFLFDDLDIRGELVHLDTVLGEASAIHSYPHGVTALLGEFLTASVLLASTLKFRGTLTVQARSDRQVPLIMAECSSQLDVRAIARGAQEAVAEDFRDLLGGGQLVLTVTPERGNRYQGIVPLTDASLAASLDSYFEHSEQLHTALFLSCDGARAAGLLLQQLPAQRVLDTDQREEHWSRILQLAATVSDEEMLNLSDEALLYRLYHEETLQLFDAEGVRLRCSCSRERTLAALATIGWEEINSILEEQGSVSMDCEFCNQHYEFSREELTEPEAGATLH